MEGKLFLKIVNLILESFFGGIPYTDHGAQITPPPLIFDFCLFFDFMLILG